MRFTALEELAEISDSTANGSPIENEQVFYATLKDVSFLNSTTYQDQEQWELKLFTDMFDGQCVGGYRVRKITTDERVEFEATSKINDSSMPIEKGVISKPEFNEECDSGKFETIKAAAKRGMIKRRHFVLIPGTTQTAQVDLFRTNEGGFHQYVKIDIELKKGDEKIHPDQLGWMFTDIIDATSQEPEHKEFIKSLYANCFTTLK